jgi:hypothetical protein
MDLVEWSRLVEVTLLRPPLICCNGKAPLHIDWPSGPWHDPDGWRARLVGHRENVGMVAGRGLLVLDVDNYKVGAEGAFDALADATGIDRRTVTAITGRDGRHLLYSYDPTLHVRSIPLEPLGFPGIEVKADGGQVIVEPSIHPDTGRSYRWEERFGPGEVEVRPASVKLLELLGAGTATAAASGGRWQPLDLGDVDELDELNVEAARILLEHYGGHDPVLLRGGVVGIYRPGKPDGSASVTIGYIAPGTFKVWTDGWPPFVQGRVYDVAQLREMAGLGPTITAPPLYVLPPGFRLWRPGDDDRPWPVLAPEARHGPVGEYLGLIEEEIEVSVAPVGAILLTELGTLIGRRAAIHVGEHRHHANLFLLVVGETSTGGKGSADAAADTLIEAVDSSFAVRHALGGFGSGEAVVEAVRDAKPDEERVEKRRIIVEAEFASVLRVARRESNILSQIIRQGFDYKPLRHRTRTSGALIATEHHLSVVGAITPDELAACSTELDLANGWLNRFAFARSQLVRLLPFGGRINRTAVEKIAAKIQDALTALAAHDLGRVYSLNEHSPAGELWAPWYREVRFGTGSVPSLTRRQHVHVARLALILAVLDQAEELTVEHLQAAMAWSAFSVATAERLFGHGATGRAGMLLAAIREAGEEGLDGRDQHALFNRHATADELAALRSQLEGDHLIHSFTVSSGGRPRLVSVAVAALRTNEQSPSERTKP